MFSICDGQRNGAFESGLTSNGFFSAAGIRDDHKQVESGKTGNTKEQLEPVLKSPLGEHQGRVIQKFETWINDAAHEVTSRLMKLLKFQFNSILCF